ncbi:hypothetical protein FACS189454_06360 [Planctomycetales bacterium]|nr:hypothetical protein FACS189454_06360 [Planctomycetales bacterium]
MNRQLLEFENKMENHFQAILDLQIEKLKILQSESGELLRFDDAKKTICWNKDSIRLTAKQYLFIKIGSCSKIIELANCIRKIRH